FTEDQFESYRRLGRHAVSKTFRGCAPGEHLVTLADRLLDMLAPGSANSESFLRHTRQLDRIWERLRMTLGAPAVASLFAELMGLQPPVPLPLTQEDTCIGLELLQFMEDVFLDLRLDDSWEHPDNRGWAMLFMSWARSPRFRQIWQGTHRTFGIRFEYFCERRLGLYRDEPVLRVATQV
ncbi:MAG TPA: hypothetical protein VKV02_03035, partial [Acidobacteriaceae bacterium]|nr:hypothetical protein [Acidobacteriaceae bacterium]